MTLPEVVAAFIDRDFARETQFLAELVKVPSNNPPSTAPGIDPRPPIIIARIV